MNNERDDEASANNARPVGAGTRPMGLQPHNRNPVWIPIALISSGDKTQPNRNQYRPPQEGAEQPSAVTDRFWIHEWAPGARGGGPRVGKWIVTIDEADLDCAWNEVRKALAKGHLGSSAKTRTAKRHPFVKPDGKTVICVYTYDSSDRGDKARVARMLSNLGFQDLRYKTDAQTRRDWHACLPSSQVEG